MAQEVLAPMHDKDIRGVGERVARGADQDERDQAAVLREVLFLCPEAFTLEELIRERTVASADVIERERVERAVRGLVCGGLLHRVGDLVLATRAAVNYYALAEV